jgi:hypothetical protein
MYKIVLCCLVYLFSLSLFFSPHSLSSSFSLLASLSSFLSLFSALFSLRFALFSLFSFISLLSFNVDEKCESLRIIHSLRRSVQKEIGYDPGCEHPHFPSAGTKTASFALVVRGPDMTSLLLLRMYYVCVLHIIMYL